MNGLSAVLISLLLVCGWLKALDEVASNGNHSDLDTNDGQMVGGRLLLNITKYRETRITFACP